MLGLNVYSFVNSSVFIAHISLLKITEKTVLFKWGDIVRLILGFLYRRMSELFGFVVSCGLDIFHCFSWALYILRRDISKMMNSRLFELCSRIKSLQVWIIKILNMFMWCCCRSLLIFEQILGWSCVLPQSIYSLISWHLWISFWHHIGFRNHSIII